MSSSWTTIAQVITNIFLFLLVFGMASTVDITSMKSQLRNLRAVSIGLGCQFFLLPFLGYAVVMMFSLPAAAGITLIIVVSSPGGSYSNWWCSLLNADLALSVTMTTFSTLFSVAFLPMNMYIYTYAAYGQAETTTGDSVLESIDFGVIFISIGVVIGAIGSGILCSWKFDHIEWWHKASYIGGNVSGILLILFSTFLSFFGGDEGSNPTPTDVTNSENQMHYVAIALPCLFGLCIATGIAKLAKLTRPERLTTAVECCYQNTGIATSAALSLFGNDPEQLNIAMRVPVIYGLVEAIFIGLYLLVFWKLGWSKAPKNEKICIVIAKSYELEGKRRGADVVEHNDGEEIEDAPLNDELQLVEYNAGGEEQQ